MVLYLETPKQIGPYGGFSFYINLFKRHFLNIPVLNKNCLLTRDQQEKCNLHGERGFYDLSTACNFQSDHDLV